MFGDPNPEYIPENPEHTFWIQATPTTSYYRCVLPAMYMNGQAVALRESDIMHGVTKRMSFPRQRGAAIWQFPGNKTRQVFMAEMQSQGTPVFVETDDNYLITSPGTPGFVQEWQLKQKPGGEEVTNRFTHRECVRGSDGVIVSTPYLAEQYTQFNSNVHVCRNSVEPKDWPEPRKLDDDVIRVGYAFSTSHYYDFELIFEGLEWAAKQPNVEVVLMGFPMPTFAAFKRFRYVNFPWTEHHAQYRRDLGILDVGLAPLKPGKWTDSKSDLKAMEYAMAGAMTIASDVEPYRPWVGEACVFPEKNTAKGWLRAFKEVIGDCDKQAIRDFAGEAKQYVLENRTIDLEVDRWKEAIASV